ncbi:MAG: TetR/AcrR family transcriptional regulator [Myxococcota bacterium]
MPSQSDGRRRRSERSRQAIVQALFDVVGEGNLRATARDVADRAGLDIRTVFRHFADMESLYVAMDERLQREALPLLMAGDPSGTVPERAASLVDQRATFFERIAPYKRAGDLQRWRSPFLQAQHRALVRELRAQLLRFFPELEALDRELTESLDLATSFEAWSRLRSEQRLGLVRARGVMERMVLSLTKELERRLRRRST